MGMVWPHSASPTSGPTASTGSTERVTMPAGESGVDVRLADREQPLRAEELAHADDEVEAASGGLPGRPWSPARSSRVSSMDGPGSAAAEVPGEEEEVGRPLGQPPDEVAVPVLAERHQDAERDPGRLDRRVKVRTDPVEHLELEAARRQPELPALVEQDPDEPLVVRREAG